jgi:hypothetical protein
VTVSAQLIKAQSLVRYVSFGVNDVPLGLPEAFYFGLPVHNWLQ